jgi:hypothetical protein
MMYIPMYQQYNRRVRPEYVKIYSQRLCLKTLPYARLLGQVEILPQQSKPVNVIDTLQY